MLAAFLPPYPFRGVPSPYLWCYYRLLYEWASESCMFIAGRDYIRPMTQWSDRWECSDEAAIRLGYSLPENTKPSQHYYVWLDDRRFDEWLRVHNGNPLATFRYFLCERDSAYEEELYSLLRSAPFQLEAVITFCNVPSLSAVCQQLGIPIIHQELGPLRGHIYRDTAYFDFRGVNGHTEAAAREEAFGKWSLPRLSREDLLGFFLKDPSMIDRLPTETAEIGVALQVEDDSNLVAFGNGMDNQALILAASYKATASSLLVRPHPGSLFTLRGGGLILDDSPTSLDFVARCSQLMTINSSVGLEALLLGKPVTMFGDNPLCYLAAEPPTSTSLISRLAYYLFAYLVPRTCQLVPEYLRFRLGQPDEQSIIAYHLDCYMKDDKMDFPEEDLLENLPTRLLAQISVSNQLRAGNIEQLQAITAQLNAIGELHSNALDTLRCRDEQLADVQRRLVEEGEAHGHAICMVEQYKERLEYLEHEYAKVIEQLNAIGELHSNALDTLCCRDEQLADVQRRLVEEGEAHGHAILMVEQYRKQLQALEHEHTLTNIGSKSLLHKLINRFITKS
jgi:hypothetical protein